ncbi:MAG: hypothetical protein IJX82_06610 [Clostridia bacterium]|nr:hypothetical protein [Clostridia bacterium]
METYEARLARFFETFRFPAEEDGIGTLGEKKLHAALKRFYAKDSTCMEVPVGRFVADVFDGERIVEIQTRQFARLQKKLCFFLERFPVTVVYPLPRTRYLIWTDPATGESSRPRKSPAVGTPLSALHELYHIRTLLGVENLTVEVLLFDLDEYRLLDGYGKTKKKGSTLVEKIPRGEPELMRLQSAEDYRALLPKELPHAFTAAELGKCAGLKGRAVYSAVHVLEELGVIEAAGKDGRATVYQKGDA